MSADLIVEQFKLGPLWNFSYLIRSRAAGEAVIVDPGAEAGVLLDRADALGLRVTTAVATHFHTDHTAGLDALVRRTGVAVLIHHADEAGLRAHYAGPVRAVDDSERLIVGDTALTLWHAPGHTPGSQWLVAGDAVFTGDALMVGRIGRIGPHDDALAQMWHTIAVQLRRLPDSTRIFPGHDDGPAPTSTIAEERRRNPCLTAACLAEFAACLP